jgi:hypothetical protein
MALASIASIEIELQKRWHLQIDSGMIPWVDNPGDKCRQ